MKEFKTKIILKIEDNTESVEIDMMGSKSLNDVFERIDRVTTVTALLIFEIVRIYCEEHNIDTNDFMFKNNKRFMQLINGNNTIISDFVKSKIESAITELDKEEVLFDA